MTYFDRRGTYNPPRVDNPTPHLSAGKWLESQRYVIGWADGVVKIGSTSHGRQRWGRFVNNGGKLLDLAKYERLMEALDGEIWLREKIARTYPRAFNEKHESLAHLGPSGGGYLECYRIPVDDWPRIIEIARSEDALV